MESSVTPKVARVTPSSWGTLKQWAVVAVLTAAAFAVGSRMGTDPASSADQEQAVKSDVADKETVIVQQIVPPAIAIEPMQSKNGARCVAIVGGADGRYWLVGDDGFAICVHDGRNDLFWWSENLTAQTILQP